MRKLGFNTDEENDPNLPRDLPPWCFQTHDRTQIQLAHRTAEGFLDPDCPPIHLEPPVPFDCKTNAEFEAAEFTHIVVAQSPQYMPASCDGLLSVIRDYFIRV